MTIDMTRFEKRAEIIKAMANAARLVLVDELSRNEKTVGALTELIDLDISTVSRHLLILRHAGIVSCRKNGNQVLYRLRTPCVLNFFDCVEKVLNSDDEYIDTCCSDSCED
ncbi:MAG: metalloregulator ArsR/SmtB family transcription factor [Candidatus Aegiribacteria sp.]|nr:metalloregulator ArsR/SmtB family transcription factor [Candidatus Aegiribacteria sp.]